MKEILNKLKESGMLDENDVNELEASFERKALENQQIAEEKIREEFALKFEQDKENLLNAVEAMVQESLNTEINKLQESIKEFESAKQRIISESKKQKSLYSKKLAEAITLLDKRVTNILQKEFNEFDESCKEFEALKEAAIKAHKNARKVYENKLQANSNILKEFFDRKLTENVQKLVESKSALDATKKELIVEQRKYKRETEKLISEHIQKFDSLVLETLKPKIEIIVAEEKNLVEQRTKLAKEADKKINESIEKFIKNATKVADEFITKTIAKEISSLKESIDEARKNKFGEEIFESYAAAFMKSHYSNDSEIKKLQDQVNKLNESLEKTKNEKSKLLNESKMLNAKLNNIQEKSLREKTLSELLSPLSRDNKNAMKTLLENIKTEDLKNAYEKYLPSVIGQKTNVKPNVLTENTKVLPVFDEKNNKNLNSVDQDGDLDIAEIIRLASVK